jgi:hypothetical protein
VVARLPKALGQGHGLAGDPDGALHATGHEQPHGELRLPWRAIRVRAERLRPRPGEPEELEPALDVLAEDRDQAEKRRWDGLPHD